MKTEDAAGVYGYLISEIMQRAETENKLLSADEAGRCAIDEQQFPEEVKFLRLLSNKLRYSEHLTDWLAKKRHVFTNDLMRDPEFRADLKRWPTMTPRVRADFINGLVARRATSFSDQLFQFALPEIEIADLHGSPGMAWTHENKISLDKSLFQSDDPAEAIAAAYHEGTHNLLTQFGIADRNGQVRNNHPFQQDMKLANYIKSFGGYARGCLPGLYKLDGEEQICYREEGNFAFEVANGNGLRARFKIAAQLIREALHGEAPTIRTAVQMLQMKS